MQIRGNKMYDDFQNPEAFREWVGEKNTPMYWYWSNLTNGKIYIKGAQDSTTKYTVMASKQGNHFISGAVYWSEVSRLPPGTYYVDCD